MSLPPSYQAVLDYIFNYVDYERKRSVPYDEVAWDLSRTQRALAALGAPQAGLRYVHVAGSKGKGSTAAYVESVLRASGLRTGFYTSPHLHTFRERIRVGGELIARADVVRLVDQARPAIEAVPGITTFEIITVLAFLHFAQQEVEWAVLEVGLGGRLDATNVITPAVSIITPISFEHTALLGNTLDEIAREKAGIIKPGVPVVCAPQDGEALAAIQEVANRQAARLILVGRDWQWRSVHDGLDGQTFDVIDPALDGLQIPLLGAHQLANATAALAACWELRRHGLAIDEASLRRGLASTRWPGRLEVLTSSPATPLEEEGRSFPPLPSLPSWQGRIVVVDSAHNRASASLLRAALGSYFPGRPLVLVFGASDDKDVAGMLQVLTPGAALVVATQSRHPRAADAALVAQAARQCGVPASQVMVASPVAEALALALQQAGQDAVICVAGSLFAAAEAREAWLALHPASLPAEDWARQAEPAEPGWHVTGASAPSPLHAPVAAP